MKRSVLVVLAAVAIVAAGVGVTMMMGRGEPVAARCEPIGGGKPGAQAQLRYLDASDQYVTFTFGLSAAPGGFDVPEFILEPLPTPADADGRATFAIHFTGMSMFNPDGSPSYFGSTALRPGRENIARLALLADADRKMEWRLALEGHTCPTVEHKIYSIGTTPRGQLIVTIGALRTITIEPPSRPTAGGTGTGFAGNSAITMSGAGFAPSSQVTISLGSRTLTETTASANGAFQVGAYVPLDVAPGFYTITARDARGAATAPFTVTLAPKPLELQP